VKNVVSVKPCEWGGFVKYWFSISPLCPKSFIGLIRKIGEIATKFGSFHYGATPMNQRRGNWNPK
jgi:hypothetical protein